MDSNKKVVVIEDDSALSDFYSEFIEGEFQTETIVFNDGASVIKYLEETNGDDVCFYICDLNIPVSKDGGFKSSFFYGFELIEQYLPVCRTIIVSGYVSPEIAKEARRLGVVSIYQKPLNLNALAIIMNFLLNCTPEVN